MYARQNNIKISYPIEIDGARVHSAQWLAGQTQAWRDANNVTIHDDPIKPVYDPLTQHPPVIGQDGEYMQPVNLTQAEIDNIVSEKAKEELQLLDMASIRDIREWVAAQPNAPQTLKDREALAVSARAKVIK